MDNKRLEEFDEVTGTAPPVEHSDTRSEATLSVLAASKLLGISRGLAYQGVRDGSLPALRVGRRWLIPRAALDALLGK